MSSDRRIIHVLFPCITFLFSFTGCIGYVQHVGSVQESRSSSNMYFDLQMQVPEEDTKQIRVQKANFSRQKGCTATNQTHKLDSRPIRHNLF